MGFNSYETKWPNLKLETQSKTTFRFYTISFRAPYFGGTLGSLNIYEF